MNRVELPINSGIPDAVAEALGLRQGRAAWQAALALSSLAVPVVVIGGSSSSSSSGVAAADQYYWAATIGVGPVAAQNTMIQLLNPAGSGKNLLVDNLYAVVGALQTVDLYMDNAGPLATSIGFGVNKQNGGAAGVGNLRWTTAVAAVGTFVSSQYSAASYDWDFSNTRGSVLLGPGTGLIARSGLVNQVLGASFEWRERPI